MYNFKKIEEMVNYVKLKNNFIIRAENLGLLNFVFVFFFSINTAKISNMSIAPLKVILNDFFQAMYWISNENIIYFFMDTVLTKTFNPETLPSFIKCDFDNKSKW